MYVLTLALNLMFRKYLFKEKKQKLTTESDTSNTKDMNVARDSLYQYAEEMVW